MVRRDPVAILSDSLTTANSLGLAVLALDYVHLTMNQKVELMSKVSNQTAVKKQAQRSHLKLSKSKMQDLQDQQLERSVHMSQNPLKILALSLKQTKMAMGSEGANSRWQAGRSSSCAREYKAGNPS